MTATFRSGIVGLAGLSLLQPMGCGGVEGEEDWIEEDESVSEDDLAARGGRRPTTPSYTVTITVAPNPVPASSNFTVTFAGLLPGHGYNVSTGGVTYWLASDTGSVTWNLHADTPTTITLTVYDVTCCRDKVKVGWITFEIV